MNTQAENNQGKTSRGWTLFSHWAAMPCFWVMGVLLLAASLMPLSTQAAPGDLDTSFGIAGTGKVITRDSLKNVHLFRISPYQAKFRQLLLFPSPIIARLGFDRVVFLKSGRTYPV